ncbi:hypothetical protein [Nocardia cyriacigeorgica]|uniref:hypothetical protein n=1 Tax=Nocardia cyriacigeorgica TaxID=135487 RepID=UPI00245696BA|nr:hypothetical protein [Nocardia cyriacigeorgica]
MTGISRGRSGRPATPTSADPTRKRTSGGGGGGGGGAGGGGGGAAAAGGGGGGGGGCGGGFFVGALCWVRCSRARFWGTVTPVRSAWSV